MADVLKWDWHEAFPDELWFLKRKEKKNDWRRACLSLKCNGCVIYYLELLSAELVHRRAVVCRGRLWAVVCFKMTALTGRDWKHGSDLLPGLSPSEPLYCTVLTGIGVFYYFNHWYCYYCKAFLQTACVLTY